MALETTFKRLRREIGIKRCVILDGNVTAKSLLAHCNLKGIVLRNCENFHGLDSHFVRFSIMNPMQNDLMVNTILELLR